jgi:hypothetical protein
MGSWAVVNQSRRLSSPFLAPIAAISIAVIVVEALSWRTLMNSLNGVPGNERLMVSVLVLHFYQNISIISFFPVF